VRVRATSADEIQRDMVRPFVAWFRLIGRVTPHSPAHTHVRYHLPIPSNSDIFPPPPTHCPSYFNSTTGRHKLHGNIFTSEKATSVTGQGMTCQPAVAVAREDRRSGVAHTDRQTVTASTCCNNHNTHF
jgi:hypothetical protein